MKNRLNNMNNLKSQTENPKGLHKRYYIQKIVINPDRDIDSSETILKPVDENAEYFVLRLDKNGSDQIHIEACRKAVLAYAEAIKSHLPELSEDLIKCYGE